MLFKNNFIECLINEIPKDDFYGYELGIYKTTWIPAHERTPIIFTKQ